jgi:hypothetical protein
MLTRLRGHGEMAPVSAMRGCGSIQSALFPKRFCQCLSKTPPKTGSSRCDCEGSIIEDGAEFVANRNEGDVAVRGEERRPARLNNRP